MGLRAWVRKRMAEAAAEGDELPAGVSLLQAVLGRDEETPHALGEYTAQTYPGELASLLRRREEVARELMALRLGDPAGRREAVPRLQELLRRYPHPLAYEALILAYVDQKRWDEAKGAAFAARERRWECEHSPYPEIRGEVGPLKAWAPEDVEVLRLEREGRLVTPGVPSMAPAAEVAEVTETVIAVAPATA